IQARAAPQARSASRRGRHAADCPERSRRDRGRLRRTAAASQSAGGRARRHRWRDRYLDPARRAAYLRAGADGTHLMAQLTDDCFAFSGPLLPIEEAERMIRERIAPVADVESVPLGAAHGRVIAHDVLAPLDLPPFDNSAVDGYAVRHADLAREGD